jgi:hypothetical protein
MTQQQEILERIGDIERRICDGEALLRSTERAGGVVWFCITVGILLILLVGDAFIIIGLVVIVACVWRLVTVTDQRKEIEEILKEYRVRKAALQVTLVPRE